MDILDILLDILLKPPQPFIGLFFTFPVACSMLVFSLNMAGLTINPVYGLISQQPGPIKMRQATWYPWSYIRNYNRIHY